MAAGIDLTGQRFGNLVAIKFVSTGSHRKWLCRCDCGTELMVLSSNLRFGNSTACGCTRRRVGAPKHGHTSTTGVSPTYVSWRAMRVRCTNTRRDGAKHYIGRSIGYDPRWDDFSVFLQDMGERPDGRTLDRINNDLGYSKENCRWATPFQQTHNRRKRPDAGVRPV